MPAIAIPAMSFNLIAAVSAAAASTGSTITTRPWGVMTMRSGAIENWAMRVAAVSDSASVSRRRMTKSAAPRSATTDRSAAVCSSSDRRTPGTCSEITIRRLDGSSRSRAIARPTAGRSTPSRAMRSASARDAGVNAANNRRRSTDRPSASTAVARSPKLSLTPGQEPPSGRIVAAATLTSGLSSIMMCGSHGATNAVTPSSAGTCRAI